MNYRPINEIIILVCMVNVCQKFSDIGVSQRKCHGLRKVLTCSRFHFLYQI